MILLQRQYEIVFYRPVNTDKQNFVSFLVFVGTADSFTAIYWFGEYLYIEYRYHFTPKETASSVLLNKK